MSSYNAKNIQVLEGLEAVRKRPGMYIANTSLEGLHQLVTELVDNSIDEAIGGYCSEIEVVIHLRSGLFRMLLKTVVLKQIPLVSLLQYQN